MPNQSTSQVSPAPSEQGSPKSLILIIIILLFLVLIVGGAAVYFLFIKDNGTENKDSCTYNNKTYEDGESFDASDGCNSCSCSDGEISCTLMACEVEDAIEGNVLHIFFAKPDSPEDFDTLDSVIRLTTETVLSPQALAQIILGPTQDEKDDGFVATFTLSGNSNCSGKDYVMTKSGTDLTVQFCKTIEWVTNPGLTDSWAGISLAGEKRAYLALEETLKFGDIQTVIIKDKDGNCYAQDAGVNLGCS